MNYQPEIITPSTEPLIELEDAKLNLRVDHDDDDTVILRMIKAVGAEIESHLGRYLISTQILQKYSGWSLFILLPFSPVISVDAVKYFDGNDEEQELASSQYEFENTELGGAICPANSSSWPILGKRLAPVSVSFTCGYGANATAIPDDIIDAAHLLLSDRYDSGSGTIEGNEPADKILSRHRHFR